MSADGSGWINFKEFLLAIGITTGNKRRTSFVMIDLTLCRNGGVVAGKDMQAKLKWAFKMYDMNNDGLIDTTEMAKIIRVSRDVASRLLSRHSPWR